MKPFTQRRANSCVTHVPCVSSCLRPTRAPKNLDFQGISDLEVWRSAPTEMFVIRCPCSQHPASLVCGFRGHAACIQHCLEWLRSPVDRNNFGWAPLVTPVQILNEAVHALEQVH